MKVLDNNNKKIDFSIENTIFQKLIDNSYSFHIFSEALPYCTMLRIKNNCEKNYNQLKFYFDGIINTLTPIKYFPKIFDILNKRSNFDISKLNELDIKNKQLLRNVRKDIGVVFQEPFLSLNPRMKIKNILAEPLLIHNPGISKDEIYEKTKFSIESVFLNADYLEKYP